MTVCVCVCSYVLVSVHVHAFASVCVRVCTCLSVCAPVGVHEWLCVQVATHVCVWRGPTPGGLLALVSSSRKKQKVIENACSRIEPSKEVRPSAKDAPWCLPLEKGAATLNTTKQHEKMDG